jgi:hypothetical protein
MTLGLDDFEDFESIARAIRRGCNGLPAVYSGRILFK